MNLKPKETAGIAAIVLASALWSVGYLIRKHISASLGPFTVTFVEAFAGSLLAMVFYRITPVKGWKAAKKGGWPMVLMAIFGVTLANSALVLGFQYTDLGVASILEKTQPIFTVILAALFLKEKLAPVAICFGLLGMIGAIEVIPLASKGGGLILTWQGAFGAGSVVCAAILWACAGVLGRKLAVDDLGPANMAFLRAAIGAITVLPLMLFFESPQGSFVELWPAYALGCLNGFLDSVVCYVLYYHGMRHVKASLTSIIEIITPVGAVMLGVLVLGEHLSLRQCIGSAIVLASVTLLVVVEIKRHGKTQQKDVAREFGP